MQRTATGVVSGRVKYIVAKGPHSSRQVPGDALQSMLGLPSTLFDFSVKGKNLVVTGYGSGHGLGLSQWGAEAWRKSMVTERIIISRSLPIIIKIPRLKKFIDQEVSLVMKLEDFNYDLPKELIAQTPAEPRDSCRLMMLDRKTGACRHGVFHDFELKFMKVMFCYLIIPG